MWLSAGPLRAGWWPLCALLVASPTLAADLTAPTVRDHADQTFQHFHTREQGEAPTNTAPAQAISSPEELLTGQGQGDLSKGTLVCQRVSELAARADIAKQIRVLVKEHATDRLRERTGREAEQDIEVVREEIVQEYLQGVRIVERRTDDTAKTCSATAVMPKPRPPAPTSAGSSAPDTATHR
ncbi:MAG: LPP20 family lipoprotein [Nitrospira sp.]|nr:LPP20 family lipoprotein [Nitrospira sp.]MBP8116388.1 LPP20 family lipoprotein [Nitrospira sp.]